MQLASFLEDPQYQDKYSLNTKIIKTFGRIEPNAEPRFRDECNLHFLTLFPELICKSKTISFSWICHVLKPLLHFVFHTLKAKSETSFLLRIDHYCYYSVVSYTISCRHLKKLINSSYF